MHVILLEPNPVRAAFYSRQLKAVHGSLAAVLPAGILAGFLGSAGRLRSRMLLTGVALDVLLLKVEGDSTAVPTDAAASDADADTGTDAVTYASDLLFDDWKKIEDQLSKVKTVMLHKNANAPVDCNTLNQYQGEGETTELSSTQVAAPGGIGEEAIDLPLLDQHTMTTVDYTEVQQLLAVQMELARLKEGLQEIVEEVDGSDVADSPKSDEIKCKKSINKAVEKATNIFMKNLSKIYPPDVSDEGGNEAGDDEDYFQDAIDRAEDDCENETDSIRSMSRHKPRLSESNILSNIPKELHSLALTELYSPKKHPHTALGMVNQILIHLASITSDAPTPAMTQPGLFSHANLQNKVSCYWLNGQANFLL